MVAALVGMLLLWGMEKKIFSVVANVIAVLVVVCILGITAYSVFKLLNYGPRESEPGSEPQKQTRGDSETRPTVDKTEKEPVESSNVTNAPSKIEIGAGHVQTRANKNKFGEESSGMVAKQTVAKNGTVPSHTAAGGTNLLSKRRKGGSRTPPIKGENQKKVAEAEEISGDTKSIEDLKTTPPPTANAKNSSGPNETAGSKESPVARTLGITIEKFPKAVLMSVARSKCAKFTREYSTKVVVTGGSGRYDFDVEITPPESGLVIDDMGVIKGSFTKPGKHVVTVYILDKAVSATVPTTERPKGTLDFFVLVPIAVDEVSNAVSASSQKLLKEMWKWKCLNGPYYQFVEKSCEAAAQLQCKAGGCKESSERIYIELRRLSEDRSEEPLWPYVFDVADEDKFLGNAEQDACSTRVEALEGEFYEDRIIKAVGHF
jgi:hypothetical protein